MSMYRHYICLGRGSIDELETISLANSQLVNTHAAVFQHVTDHQGDA
jgi:hypothetical protein